MRVLVVGRGWTGNKVHQELLSRGHESVLVSHDFKTMYSRIDGSDWVVNCAGVTGTPNVDACENDKLNTYKGNAVFPVELYDLATFYGARFAHFSSGCIYQGTIESVDADPNYFGSTYSISKGISDMILKNTSLVFRIRMPFTGVNERKNYLTKVYNYAQTAKLWDGGYNSMTDLDEAVKVACNLIEDGETGSQNLVNQGALNMHEVAEIMGITPEWFSDEDFTKATAAGRSTCTIPSHPWMSDVRGAMVKAVAKMKDNSA